MSDLMRLLTEIIGLSDEAATALIAEFGELAVQRHAIYCLWMMNQGKVHVPPAWLTALLRGDWNAPHGMPSDWLPTVLHFRVDENTFAEIRRGEREHAAEMKTILTE